VRPAPVCTCNKEGKIKISWQPATEDDLLGYRVFISNNNNPGDMLQITTDIIKDTLYYHQVTMNTLSENIYFSVRALDMRENMSPLSPPCLAVRPDVIPPSAPVIIGYTHELNGTRFTYQASTSDDVVSYELQRRLKSYVKWDMISKTTPNQLKPFTDTTAFRRHRYEYRLVAFDETGLGGSSAILDVKPFDDGVRDSIHNMMATKVGGPPPAAVVLSWNYPQFRDPDLIGFQILRAVGGDPMRTLVFLNLLQADAANNGVLDPLAVPGAFGFADLDTREFRQIINQGLVMPISAVPSLTGGATGVAVRYSVYAKYIDGAMSPLANITVTW
jgi:hypothetical protein